MSSLRQTSDENWSDESWFDIEEHEARDRARRSLIGFTEYTLPIYKPAPHHRLIAEQLEAVECGELLRLMIFAPPRHGKSELASVRLPAWYLGRHPDRDVISIGYGTQFTEDFGRQVRNIVNGRDFRRAFPGVELAPDNQAAGRWQTKQGGGYRAGSLGSSGGNIMGRGAHLLIIDDPVKGHEEAESQLLRDKIWNSYLTDAYTRRMPYEPLAIVLIQTRWHWDDLAGRLLEQAKVGGDQWTVVELPAMLDGAPLWPEGFPLAELEQIRAVEGPRNWTSLYQQRPTPDEGGYFERKHFRYYDAEPEHLKVYGASDYAVSEKHGDWTVHLVVGIDPKGDIYLLDLWRAQSNTLDWVETLFVMVERYLKRLHVWGEEEDQIKRAMGPFISKMQQERDRYWTRYALSPTGDKELKARTIQARMQQGRVWFPRNAAWLATFEAELLQFPAGQHDDQVDALGMIGRMLDGMRAGEAPKVEPPPAWALQGKGDRIRIDFAAIDKNLNIHERG